MESSRAFDPKRKEWADSYASAVTEILRQHAGIFVEIAVADDDTDMKRATDFVLKVRGGDIACRVRKENYWPEPGDITFRHRLKSGLPSETDKIKGGYANWMFYGWARGMAFIAWVLIGLEVVRQSHLIEEAEDKNQIIPVPGGNWLLYLTLWRLQIAQAIVASGGDAIARLASLSKTPVKVLRPVAVVTQDELPF